MRTIWQNAIRLKAVSRQALAVAVGLLLAAPAFAQATGSSPWENAVNALMTALTSTIARGLSLGAPFHADKPHLWSPGQFTDRGLANPNFGLHPDGKRFAVLRTSGKDQTPAVNRVSFIFNFFDELRSKLPPGK